MDMDMRLYTLPRSVTRDPTHRTMRWILLAACVPAAVCFQCSSLAHKHAASVPAAVCFQSSGLQHAVSVRSPPPKLAATVVSEEQPLLELLEERRFGDVVSRTFEKPSAVIDLIKDAGLAGVIAYFVAAAAFYSVACTAGELAYHASSGSWVDPRVLLAQEDTPGRTETAALLASFYLLCKPFAPLRLGGALVLMPNVKNFIEARPALQAGADAAGELWESTVGAAVRAIVASPLAAPVRREVLKSELLDLAAKSEGGIAPLSPEDSSRLYEIATRLLPDLSPTASPASSDLFSAEWECAWTDEKEINFARTSGLFGLAWERTYQTIDVPRGSLTNVLAFEKGGELRVESSIAPDEDDADGKRFVFSFSGCALRWKSVEVPLPPVGRGWGELLYLDGEMRVQRDVRGDLLIATRVGA